MGEVFEDEVEELFAFFGGGEVGAACAAFLGALVQVSADKHAVESVRDEFPCVGEFGGVDEFWTNVKHEGGFEFAGVTYELMISFEDTGLWEIKNVPVTSGGNEGVGIGELEFSCHDSHGVNVAPMAIEKKDALKVILKKGLSQAVENILVGVEGGIESGSKSKVVGTGS